MKTAATLILCIILVGVLGCDNRGPELEKQVAALQQANGQLVQENTIRDAYIDSIALAINAVYSNLETMKSHEQHLLKEKKELEAQKKYTDKEIREMLFARVSSINTALKDNRETILGLQKKLAASRTKYAGLQKMVETLKSTIAEREQAIAELTQKVQGLQTEVSEKTRLVGERDEVISRQHKQMATAFYVIGKRDELEKKGIISKQGGFPWGWLGSTTILSNGLDEANFQPINKEEQKIIQVKGKIDEVIPKRNSQAYATKAVSDSESMITIADPSRFWESNYLVIITD